MLLETGEVLADRFEIRGFLGQGGMAEVYLALDRRLGTELCVKVLFPHLRSQPILRSRFEREVAAARKLDHPNIVRIFELVEDGEQLFFTMEFLPGSDLKRLLRRSGRLPFEQILHLGAQMAAALEAAHGQGIVHRDVKPQNILVGADGGVKLVDFGLAHMTGLVGMTMGTALLATPEYGAPELLSGSVVDPRADLYSFGVVLYEMATGRLPFRGPLYEVLRQHIETPPPRLRELRPDLPQWFDDLVARALEKDADRRFQTAAEMRECLVRSSLPKESSALARLDEGTRCCFRCHEPMLPFMAICLECGCEPLALSRKNRGWHSVYLKGWAWWKVRWRYGHRRDPLTYQQKAQVVALVEELTGQSVENTKRMDRKLRNLPTEAFRGLSKKAAEEVASRFEAMGVPATICHQFNMFKLGWRDMTAWTAIYAMIVMPILLAVFDDPVVLVWIAVILAMPLLRLLFSSPLGRLTGGEARRGAPALAARCREVLPKLRSSRLKKLIRKILLRYSAVHDMLTGESRSLFKELAPELPVLEEMGERALLLAVRIQRLEDALADLDEGEIFEVIQTLDAEIESETDTLLLGDLVRQRSFQEHSLEQLREAEQALTELYGELIRTASTLGGTIGRLGSMDGRLERASTPLPRLLKEMEEQLDRATEVLDQVGPVVERRSS